MINYFLCHLCLAWGSSTSDLFQECLSSLPPDVRNI